MQVYSQHHQGGILRSQQKRDDNNAKALIPKDLRWLYELLNQIQWSPT